jgi:hypothetical protein
MEDYSMGVMQPLKAIVRNGKLVLDETPTDLPEGTELELVVADQGDDLDDEERARLHASIDRGLADIKAGRVTDIDDVLNELD